MTDSSYLCLSDVFDYRWPNQTCYNNVSISFSSIIIANDENSVSYVILIVTPYSYIYLFVVGKLLFYWSLTHIKLLPVVIIGQSQQTWTSARLLPVQVNSTFIFTSYLYSLVNVYWVGVYLCLITFILITDNT